MALLPDWLLTSPGSTIFILCFSILITFITSLTNRLLVNREQIDAWRREIAAWTADSQKAQRTGDKKLLAKVKKQQPRIVQLQSKMLRQSFKPMLVYMIPLMLLWQFFLIPLYGTGTIAYLPGLFGGEWELPLFWWYMLCSFLFGTLFSRVFGIVVTGSE